MKRRGINVYKTNSVQSYILRDIPQLNGQKLLNPLFACLAVRAPSERKRRIYK
jgi:hypothetical protein